MMLSLLISSFASSFERWYVRLLGVPALVAGVFRDLGLSIERGIDCHDRICFIRYLAKAIL